jgi:serine/threonine-protein kinase
MNDEATRLRQVLGDRYTLERELGSGGMATVYLARDRKHDRLVAIKVLRPVLAAALGSDRFLREITTTANLRHPHILPLYDSGEADGLLYYVMPYVEGESLRDRLNRERQLPLADALRIASEVADALGYAHTRGILHRDIKPENILLESGHAVVADFGIARAIDLAGGDRLTETGMIVGTAPYMSPEQADGDKNLDGRSDQYALACVTYEMLAGQPPFTGPTVESIIRQHMIGTPTLITQLRASVPRTVVEALDRGLAKAPADRFGSTAQFGEALTRNESVPGTRTVASRRRSGIVFLAGGVATVILLVLAGALLRSNQETTVHLGRRIQVTLDPGLELDPALSPDGRLIAYSDAASRLMVRQVEGGSAGVPLLRGDADRGRWPAWTPDGQQLLFISARGIETVPSLGGVPRLVVPGPNLQRGLAMAPDGREFGYISHDSVIVRSLTNQDQRVVATGFELHSPAWSPDGRRIAYVSGDLQFISSADLGNIARSSIWVVDAGGGAAGRVSDDQSLNVSPAWLSGSILLYVSDREGGRDVYQVGVGGKNLAEGTPVRLTTGLNPLSIALTPDGRRLVYSAFSETSNVWSLAIPRQGTVPITSARQETRGNQMIENIDASFDGRWLGYTSNRTGTTQVYREAVGDGPTTQPEQITGDTMESYWVTFSPDGTELALHRFVGERRQIFVVRIEGGTTVPVTDGSEDIRSPEWSPDGRRLVMLANYGTTPSLRIVTRTGSGWSPQRRVPVVIGSDTVRAGLAVWSPDGQWLACGCGEGGIVVLPAEGGPARRLSPDYSTAGWALPQWSADGRSVFHISQDSAGNVAVVGVPVDGGPGRIVVSFDVPAFEWHRYGFRVRGNRMFMTLGDRQSDVWVTELGR